MVYLHSTDKRILFHCFFDLSSIFILIWVVIISYICYLVGCWHPSRWTSSWAHFLFLIQAKLINCQLSHQTIWFHSTHVSHKFHSCFSKQCAIKFFTTCPGQIFIWKRKCCCEIKNLLITIATRDNRQTCFLCMSERNT